MKYDNLPKNVGNVYDMPLNSTHLQGISRMIDSILWAGRKDKTISLWKVPAQISGSLRRGRCAFTISAIQNLRYL